VFERVGDERPERAAAVEHDHRGRARVHRTGDRHHRRAQAAADQEEPRGVHVRAALEVVEQQHDLDHAVEGGGPETPECVEGGEPPEGAAIELQRIVGRHHDGLAGDLLEAGGGHDAPAPFDAAHQDRGGHARAPGPGHADQGVDLRGGRAAEGELLERRDGILAARARLHRLQLAFARGQGGRRALIHGCAPEPQQRRGPRHRAQGQSSRPEPSGHR
jgi:hypothetical protein